MTTARQQLKTALCQHFLDAGVAREALPKVIIAFKQCVDEGREFEQFFAPRHHEALESFQAAYFAILDAEAPEEQPQQMTKRDAQEIFADPQSSPSLLREAARILGY